MSKKIVQSFSLATLLSAVAFGFSIPLPARAQSLRDCVVKYQRDYGISADEALRQCRRFGEESPRENRGACINSSTQGFTLGNYNNPAGEASDFCVKGGNSSCLAQSFEVFKRGNYNNPAGEASDFCVKGGDSSCLAQSFEGFKQGNYNNPAGEAAKVCLR